MDLKFITWNVNGLRAAAKKGFVDFLRRESPDFLCIQEVKAMEDQIPFDVRLVEPYQSYFVAAERRGYSGVATYAKHSASKIITQLGEPRFDNEGRHLFLEYDNFILGNIYFPNGGRGDDRLKYKLEYYEKFLEFVTELKKTGKMIIFCGDVNTAHKEIDLFHPKENQKKSGFMPEERAWLDKFIAAGFVDVFRKFNQEPHQYTWWDMKSRARDRNIGWRIDYFFVDREHEANVTAASLMPEILGSDHCPVKISVNI